MKTKKLACFALALAFGGCLPSLHPLYTEETLTFREELLGKWSNGESLWEFWRAGDQEYAMRAFDGEEGRFSAHLVQLDDMLFLDLYPDEEIRKNMQDFSAMHFIPAHSFLRVEQIEPKLLLRVLDVEEIDEMLEDDPNLLKHERMEDGFVLTASTNALQAFMLAFAHDEDLFGDATEFSRRAPLYAETNLTFADSLLGRYEDRNGEVMEVTRENELTYRMTCAEEDGRRQRCLANLVQVEDLRLLAVFFDESALEEEDAHARHLLPDFFMQVDETEPKPSLQPIDYDDAAALLGFDGEEDSERTPDEDTGPKPFDTFQHM